MLYLFGILTWWLRWLICLDWDFQYHDFMYFFDTFVWDIDVLDCCWLIVLYCLAHWLWFCVIVLVTSHAYTHHCISFWLDMLIHLPVYYLDRPRAWCLYYYSSWLSYSRLSCVYISDVSCSAWLYDAWLPSLCMIACRLSMWVSLLSPYLQLSWFRSFLSSRFSLLQVWDLLCACSLTELGIRSRV